LLKKLRIYITLYPFVNPAGGRYLRDFCILFYRYQAAEKILEVMIMVKMKSNFDYIKEIRFSWVINPRTRVQENNMKNKKKRRQEDKKMIKDGFEI
jgi:hypothetical protein